MMSRLSFLLFVCLSGFFLTPLQSSAFTSPADSLKVRTANGKKVILHKVLPRETWSHLARKYQCTVEELMAANNGIEIIKIDQIVNIPVNSATASKTSNATTATPSISKANTAPNQQNSSAKTPVTHTVKSGETLFAIAKKYDQPVNTIKEYNNLTADGIRPGQKLIIKYIGNTGNQVIALTETQSVLVPPPAPKSNAATAELATSPAATTSPNPKTEKQTIIANESPAVIADNFFDKPTKSVTTVKKGNGGKSMMQVTETGVATWIQDGSQSGNKYFGLHRTAPIGTIVKVTNRMNNMSVYVKIVGVLPDTGDNDNVIIKMSQAVSEKLNALDTFFQVELSYGIME